MFARTFQCSGARVKVPVEVPVSIFKIKNCRIARANIHESYSWGVVNPI